LVQREGLVLASVLRNRGPRALQSRGGRPASTAVPREERLDGHVQQGGALLLGETHPLPQLSNLAHRVDDHDAIDLEGA